MHLNSKQIFDISSIGRDLSTLGADLSTHFETNHQHFMHENLQIASLEKPFAIESE